MPSNSPRNRHVKSLLHHCLGMLPSYLIPQGDIDPSKAVAWRDSSFLIRHSLLQCVHHCVLNAQDCLRHCGLWHDRTKHTHFAIHADLLFRTALTALRPPPTTSRFLAVGESGAITFLSKSLALALSGTSLRPSTPEIHAPPLFYCTHTPLPDTLHADASGDIITFSDIIAFNHSRILCLLTIRDILTSISGMHIKLLFHHCY